jgi:hypothetical protein
VVGSDAGPAPEAGRDSGTDAALDAGADAAMDASNGDSSEPPPDASCCPALDDPLFDWEFGKPACDPVGCGVGDLSWCTSERGETALDAAFPGCISYASDTNCPRGILAWWTCVETYCTGCTPGAIFTGDDFATLCTLTMNGMFDSSGCTNTL